MERVAPPSSPAAADDWPLATSPMAVWALVLGIAGLLTVCVGVGFVLGIIAVVLGALGTAANPQSLWIDGRGNGSGSVGFSDGTSANRRTPYVHTIYDEVANADDDLFDAAGPNDALQIHSGR